MGIKREYVVIFIIYLLVALYIIFIGDLVVSVLLLSCLFIYHLYRYIRLESELSTDKEKSLSKIQSRLDRTRREREEVTKRFLSLSTSFGSGLLLMDDDGIIKHSNKEVEEYFGKDFYNMDYQQLTEYKGLHKFLNQAFLLEVKLREQIIYNDKYFDLISTPLFEGNIFKGAFILISDITQLKNAEKYQKRFTADVSHELRTPLSAIKGFSEILARGDSISKEDREEFINHIKTESERMEVILSDLLIISKMDRLDYEMDLSNVNIAAVLEETVSLLRNQFKEKNLVLTLDAENQDMKIDKFKISQVILNMLKNSLNYTDNGSVSLSGKIKDNNYIIKIQDTGIGIEEKNYERIFKRFYRVDKDRSRETGGSGLGLSISKNVILKHGGNITVESELGKGTTFIITLPINE